MEFVPNIKPKKNKIHSSFNQPYPELKDKKIIGYFNGYSVEVLNHNDIISLYNNGCYGKGSESRSAPNIVIPQQSQGLMIKNKDGFQNETLILDLEESFFLNYIAEVLEIHNIFNNTKIRSIELLEKFLKIKENFHETFIVYLYLKSKNWIIKSGIKFGADFLIYKKGIHLYHASFIVLTESNLSMRPKDIQGTQRVAETSDKDVLILTVHYPANYDKIKNKINFLNQLTEFSISELIIKRFNFKQFAQKRNKNKKKF